MVTTMTRDWLYLIGQDASGHVVIWSSLSALHCTLLLYLCAMKTGGKAYPLRPILTKSGKVTARQMKVLSTCIKRDI